jgi:hypothetical protein
VVIVKFWIGFIVGTLGTGCMPPSTEKVPPTGSNQIATVSISDTLVADLIAARGPDSVFVRFLTLNNGSDRHLIEWGAGKAWRRGDLDELTEGQGYRIAPTVLWSNRDFICMMTNHTGPLSQHLFLPLRNDLKPRFYSEDVEYADSLDNFVCFIDSVDDLHGKVHWKIVSLYDGKGRPFQTSICGLLDGYPWHTGLTRIDDSLVLGSPCERNGRMAESVIQDPARKE